VQRLTIGKKFPSLNDTLRKAKRHWANYHKEKSELTYLVKMHCKQQRLRKSRQPVFLQFTWYEPNRKRDMDNVSFAKKYVLDGMVEAGVLDNDSPRYISGWTERFLKAPRHGVDVIIVEQGDT